MTTVKEKNQRSILPRLWILVILSITTLHLTACSKSAPSPEIPDEGIIIIKEYVNWAWGYQHHGSFIDIKGNVYEFDFSDSAYRNDITTEQEFLEELESIYQSSQPIASVDASLIEKCYLKIAEIDLNAEIKSESAACDMGQNSLYVLSNHQMVLLNSIGDLNKERDDKAAREIVNLCKKLVIN